MGKSAEKNKKTNFLKEGIIDGISKKHSAYLGITVPKEYFAKSKIVIIDQIKSEAVAVRIKEKKQLTFWMLPNIKYIAVASLVFILGLTVWFQKDDFSKTNFELFSFSEDHLINSLFIKDSEFEAFADATLINEIIIKAELSERKIDDLFLNYLFLEDSLIEIYTDKNFIETIIL
jgi:NADH:ubiquinone oxidoreductase subunit 5 (subunit L)/multisubunit Na+/H+ antiporter MnhA subunit